MLFNRYTGGQTCFSPAMELLTPSALPVSVKATDPVCRERKGKKNREKEGERVGKG